MKTLITLAAMMIALTFGTVYADESEFPFPSGMVIAPVAHSTYDWSLKGQAAVDHLTSRTTDDAPVLGSNNDISKAFAGPEPVLADKAKGSAAGGLVTEDETTRIWDNLLGAPGGSDLP